MTAATNIGTMVRRAPGPRAGPGGMAAVRSGPPGAVAVTKVPSRGRADRMVPYFSGHISQKDHDSRSPT